jgi:hypothetical protein
MTTYIIEERESLIRNETHREITATTSGNFPVFRSEFRLYISTEPFSK